MNELELKYGCNPNQKPARVFMKNGAALPFTVLNGKPGYINLLDAFNSWQLVRELKEATGLPAAASFKHVSPDGIIAPAYSDEALAILKTKKGGKYNVVQLDPAYAPAPLEQKDVFGITFEQGHNDCKIDESLLQNIVTENKGLPESAKRDMLLALITLKYTQSNSVCYVKDAQTVGVGAGQQSRIHCTRLAGPSAM